MEQTLIWSGENAKAQGEKASTSIGGSNHRTAHAAREPNLAQGKVTQMGHVRAW
jgi:hypothetical protein